MVRALLTSVLMALVALPQGICFCHFVEAGPVVPICCDMEAPASPADEPDDHDADCPCMLREALAAGPAPVDAERGDSASLIAQPVSSFCSATLSNDVSFDLFRTIGEPLALIPCALRI